MVPATAVDGDDGDVFLRTHQDSASCDIDLDHGDCRTVGIGHWVDYDLLGKLHARRNIVGKTKSGVPLTADTIAANEMAASAFDFDRAARRFPDLSPRLQAMCLRP